MEIYIHAALIIIAIVSIYFFVLRPKDDKKAKHSFWDEKDWIIYDIWNTIGRGHDIYGYKAKYSKIPTLLYSHYHKHKSAIKGLILDDYDRTVFDIAKHLDVEYLISSREHYDDLVYFGIIHEVLEDVYYNKYTSEYCEAVQILIYCLKRFKIETSALSGMIKILEYSDMVIRTSDIYDYSFYKSLYYFAKEYIQCSDRELIHDEEHLKKAIPGISIKALIDLDKKCNSSSSYVFQINIEASGREYDEFLSRLQQV